MLPCLEHTKFKKEAQGLENGSTLYSMDNLDNK